MSTRYISERALMRAEHFIKELAQIRLDSVFNPYADLCAMSDLQEAPAIRRANLLAFMRAAKGRVRSIWFGRDLGYRGGRRTGLPLTDEHHLAAFSARYGGVAVAQATKGPPVAERTAAVIWSMLHQLTEPPFLWNVFPFHPHAPGDPMSNRCHTAAERRTCAPVITTLIDWLQPETIVAIGNDAFNALTDLGYPCQHVRHPSYGGQSDFIRGITRIYRLSTSLPVQRALL